MATVLALRARQIEVTVVEQDNFGGRRIGEHLSPDAWQDLQQLGVSQQALTGEHHASPGVRSAWGSWSPAERDYIFSPYGRGLNLSRPAFDQTLAKLAHQRGARVLAGARFRHISGSPGQWRVKADTASGSALIRAKLVVDASGRAAPLARALNVERFTYDSLVGVVGFLRPKRMGQPAASGTLTVEAVAGGWWYLAAIADGRCVAAYMTDRDLMERERSPLQVWRAALRQTSLAAEMLRDYSMPRSVATRSARTQRLARSAGHGWLAVGDAAMGFDPLSSAGIAKGLRGGLAAASAIEGALAGQAHVLQEYENSTQKDFAAYLQTRSDYYRVEQRWPDSPFWRRRHGALPWERPLTLSPHFVLQRRPARDYLEAFGGLTHDFPGLNTGLLVELTETALSAGDLVARYHRRTDHSKSDSTVISALQHLVDRKVLVVCDRPASGLSQY